MHRVIVAAGEPGGAENTLRCYSVDADGALMPLGPETPAGIQNMYCASHWSARTRETYLYSVDINCAKDPVRGRDAEGLIKAWRVEDSGTLTLLSISQAGGVTPCHCWLSPAPADNPTAPCVLLVANYGDETSNSPGSVSSFLVAADGSLGAACQVFPISPTLMLASTADTEAAAAAAQVASDSPVPSPAARQTTPHPHMVTTNLSGELAYAVDLGANAVIGFTLTRFPTTALRGAVSVCHLHPGAGPRHLVFHPSAPAAFTVNELDSTVSLLGYQGDASSGELVELSHVQAVPANWHTRDNMNASCAIAISPDGRHIYASNRGHDSVACFAFAMGEKGDPSLQPISYSSSGGSLPWTLCSPHPADCLQVEGLVLVQNQGSMSSAGAGYTKPLQQPGNVTAFRRQVDSGALVETGATTSIESAMFIAYLPTPRPLSAAAAL